MGDGAAEDEAARLDAGDLVDLAAGPRLHQFVDGAAERPRIAEKGGDVAKHDAGLRVIRDAADRGLEVIFQCQGGHERGPHSIQREELAASVTLANHDGRRNRRTLS